MNPLHTENVSGILKLFKCLEQPASPKLTLKVVKKHNYFDFFIKQHIYSKYPQTEYIHLHTTINVLKITVYKVFSKILQTLLGYQRNLRFPPVLKQSYLCIARKSSSKAI